MKKKFYRTGPIGRKRKARKMRNIKDAVYVQGQPKGSLSTHLMVDNIKGNTSGKYKVWPSITLTPGIGKGYKKQSWKQATNKGEMFTFRSKKRAKKFAFGSWKKKKYNN